MVMIRLPPGVPSTSDLMRDIMKVGVIDDSGRLPGLGALAAKPITPNALGDPA